METLSKKPFEIIEGSIEILFCAPHSQIHRRPNLRGVSRQAERGTDQIVRDLAQLAKTYGAYMTEPTTYDPNFHPYEQNQLKKALIELVQQRKIRRFVDVHGMSDAYPFDLLIYYPQRYSNSLKFARKVAQLLDSGQLRGLSTLMLNLPDDRESIAGFLAKGYGVPSIQIEVARYIREDRSLMESFCNNLALIAADI